MSSRRPETPETTSPTAEPELRAATTPKRKSRFRSVIVVLIVLAVAGWFLKAPTVRLLNDQAEASIDARDHEKALSMLTWSDRLDSQNPRTAYLMVRVNRRLEEFDVVHDWLQKANDRGWDVGDLEREQLLTLAQTSQFEDVRPHWNSLFINVGSDGPELCNAYVVWCLSLFRLDDALRVIDAWQKEYPDAAQPYLMKGRIAEVMLRWAEAVDEYTQALEREPDRSDIRLRLGKALLKQQKNQQAVDELATAFDETGDPEARISLAEACRKSGDTERARNLLSEALTESPQDVEALFALGELELESDRPQEAVSHLELAATIRPEDNAIRYALLQALQRTGRNEEAKEHLKFVQEATKPMLELGGMTADLVERPEDIDLRYRIAMTTWRYKSRAEGAQWLRSLLDRQPDYALAHKAMANHHRLMGETEKADAFQRSFEMLEEQSPAINRSDDEP